MCACSYTRLGLLALASLTWAACEHSPPGTHVDIAYAKRPVVVRLPATPVPLSKPAPSPSLPNSEPSLAVESKTEQVAEAYSRGEFCAKAGKDAEAIAAFKEAVKLDPTFVDAWNYLATLYEKAGNEKEAMNAFKHAKGAPAPTKGAG